jgi:hypothetical protein
VRRIKLNTLVVELPRRPVRGGRGIRAELRDVRFHALAQSGELLDDPLVVVEQVTDRHLGLAERLLVLNDLLQLAVPLTHR